MDEQANNVVPSFAALPDSVECRSEVYHPGGRAFLAGMEVTEQLKDCSVCPKCGVYGRKNLIRADGCFRCNPRRRPKAEPRRDGLLGAVLVAGVLIALGIAVGALLVLAIR